MKVDDTNDQTTQTMQDWVEFYNHFYETYGRKVELVPFTATGDAGDEVAARADAITIAQDIKPFAVLGRPDPHPGFGDELAAREVLCISCGPATSYDYVTEHAPYVWGLGNLPEQGQTHVVEYISQGAQGRQRRVRRRPGAGSQHRKFGLIYISTSERVRAGDRPVRGAAEGRTGWSSPSALAYKSPVDLQNDAPGLIAKLKAAGVTSVLFTGDPVAPQPLTGPRPVRTTSPSGSSPARR